MAEGGGKGRPDHLEIKGRCGKIRRWLLPNAVPVSNVKSRGAKKGEERLRI